MAGRWVTLAVGSALLVLALVPVSQLMDGTGTPWGPLAREWARGTIAILAVALVLADVASRWTDRAIAVVTGTVMRPSGRAFAWVIGGVAFAICAVLAWVVHGAAPATGDEMSMRFQARLLASGRLFAVAEAQREFFNTPQALDTNGRWSSQFPIGWPLILAPALRLGVEWLVGPLFTGLATALFYRFLSRVTTETAARFAAILMTLSPWMLFMGSTQGSHLGAVAMSLLALGALARWSSTDDARALARSAAVVGFGIASTAAIRPYDGALVALPVAIYQVIVAGRSRARWMSFAAQIAGGIIPVAILLYANARTTGDPLLFAYDAVNGPEHRPGFHMSPRGFEFTPAIALMQLSAMMQRLDSALLEAPIPAVAIVALGLLLVRRPTRWDLLLTGMLVTVVVGYWAYWSESYFARGPRFLLAALPAFIWFLTRAPMELAARTERPMLRRAAYLFLPLAVLVAWRPAVRPFRQSGFILRADALRQSSQTLKVDIPEVVRESGVTNGLVFVNESWRARLLTRLRVLGLPPGRANIAVDLWDACLIHHGLNDEDNDPRPGAIERVGLKAMAAGRATPSPGAQVSFAPNARRDGCMEELKQELEGIVPYALFLSHQRFDDEGRLAGPVVFAIDYGDRNERLRARFGDRRWYRLRPVEKGGDTTFAIVPY